MRNKVQLAPVNTNNFLRWYPNVTPTIDNSTFSTGLHNGYTYKWRIFNDVLPVLVGDTLTFYTNFDNTSFLDSKSIKVVESDTCGNYTVINDATKYVVASSGWGTNNAKITLTIPVTNTTNNHDFRLAIVDGVDAISYVSNNFNLRQKTAKNINNTHLVSFYSLSNVYNYEWQDFDPLVDDLYKIRVPSSKVGVEYPSEKDVYREATTGRPRVTRAINNKQYQFEIYYNTEELHDAISTVSNFRYFAINDREYIVDSYEINFERNLNVFKGILTLRDVEFDKRINVCVS